MSFDTQHLHPTMVLRNERLLEECERRGWTIGATRVTADYAAQKALYDAWKSGKGNTAANPDALGDVSPWGWQIHGSYHQIQHDGWSHAVDYTIAGCTWDEFHRLAAEYGIGFPLMTLSTGPEPWHAQWWDARGIYIDFEEDNMNDTDMRTLAGYIAEAIAKIPVTVHDYDNNTSIASNLAQVKGWDHDELGQIRRK